MNTKAMGRAMRATLDGVIGPYGLTIAFRVMPELDAEAYAELKADIKANGIHDPVMIDQEDRVVDGHQRLQIADELGFDSDEIIWNQVHVSDPAAGRDMAYRVNAHRRHLTRDQKRDALARSLRADPELSDRAHGERLGVDHKTVGAHRQRLESTGEIPQSATRESRDGRERPATQPHHEVSSTPDPTLDSAGADPRAVDEQPVRLAPSPTRADRTSDDIEEARRREVLVTARHARERILSALRLDTVAIVAGIELGEDLVTPELVAELRATVAVLEGQLARTG